MLKFVQEPSTMQPPRPETVLGSWEHFPHQADIGVRGIGSTTAAAFESAAHALTAVITDPGSVASTDSVPIVCETSDDELLPVDWLNAFVYEMAPHVLPADRRKGER